ncbi:MAG: HEAT repeat domain-containing protein [bacterium]
MKKLSVFLLIFSVILTSVTPAHSWPWSRNRRPLPPRTATIQGRVTDSITNQAISGATVRAGSHKAVTNANGNYSIKNIKVWFWGRIYRVRAEAKGYYTSSRWIYVRKGRTYTLNFRLRPRKPLILVKIDSPEDNSYIKGTSLDVIVSWQGRAGIIDLYLDNNLAGSYRTWRWWHRSGNHTFKVDISVQQDGEHKLKAIAYRSHRRRGYKAESKEITFILDNSLPVISDISPVDNALINNNQPEISTVLSDATSGIDKDTIILKVDDAEVTAGYDEVTGKVSYTPETALADGTHTILIEVKDRARNEASVTSTFTIDATSPVISNILPEDGSETTETRPLISANYSDSGSGINATTAKILVGNINQTSHAVVTETGISYKPAEDLLYGVIGVHIEIKDNAENLAQVDYEFTIRDYVQELEDGVSEGDWDKICESADKIMKEGGKLVDELIEAAKDETKDIVLRSMYLEILGEIEDSKAVDSLINVVKDDSEDSEIRANAAYSLGKIGDSRAVQPLLEELDNEDTNIRSTISLALGLLNAPEAIAPLLDQLNNSKDLTERIRAGSSLASMKAQQAYDSFISILTSDEDESIRLLSALWLGELGDILAVPSLINALKDKSSCVACNAAIALGILKDTSAVQPLIEALEDEGLLRIEAAEALAEIGDQSAAQAIADVIEIEKDTWGLTKLKEAYKKLTGNEYE